MFARFPVAALLLFAACAAPAPRTISPTAVTATDRAAVEAYFAPQDQGAVTLPLRGLTALTGDVGDKLICGEVGTGAGFIPFDLRLRGSRVINAVTGADRQAEISLTCANAANGTLILQPDPVEY